VSDSVAIQPGPGYDRRYFERAYFEDHPGKRRSHAFIVRQLAAVGLAAGHVLDVGAGTGYMLRELLAAGYTCAGLDHSAEAIERAQGLEPVQRGDVELQLGDVCARIPWPDESFDAVVLHDVVEHLEDDHGAVRELKRVVRPGGFVIVSTMNAGGLLSRVLGSRWAFYRDPTHVRPYDLPALVALFGYQGFRIKAWDTFFDLNKAGETTRWLAPLRRLGWVVPGFGLGETALLIAQRPLLEVPAWNQSRH